MSGQLPRWNRAQGKGEIINQVAAKNGGQGYGCETKRTWLRGRHYVGSRGAHQDPTLRRINLRSSYHQLRVHEDSIPKIAFRTRYGHFRVLRNRNLLKLLKRSIVEHLVSLNAQKRRKLYAKFLLKLVRMGSPRTPTEVRSFLGLAGYYCRFIENFSKIAKSLTILTQNSLDRLEDYVVYCDASGIGLGCVLMQRDKVIAYAAVENS
ncbi:hypothetical protein Tco_0723657 [Tanacetum coccineum]